MLTKLRVINNISVLKHETNAEKIVGLRARPPMSHRTCPTQRMSKRACDFPKRKNINVAYVLPTEENCP